MPPLVELSGALARLSAEASHHYLLGFNPPAEARGAGLRRVRVDVDHPGSSVRARKGYFLPREGSRPPENAAGTLPARLQEALSSPYPLGGIPLRLATLHQDQGTTLRAGH